MTLPFRPTTVAHLLIIEEIRLLVVAYGYRVDGGDGDVADLFAEDGVWDSTDSGYPRLEGRQRIAEFFSDSASRRLRGHRLNHAVLSPLITYLTEDEVHSISSFVGQALFAGRSDVVLDAGRYHDQFVRTSDGWRFRTRRLEHVFPTRIQPAEIATGNKPMSRTWP